MKVKVLKQKYRCGSGYGTGFYDQEGFLETLNKIIEWDKVEFPTRGTGVWKEIDITSSLEEIEKEGDGFDLDIFRRQLQSLLSQPDTEKKRVDGKEYVETDFGPLRIEGNKVMEAVEEEEEIKDYLGTPPELRPGNVFLWDSGQIISIDSPTRLIVNVSESGPLAVKRFWEEYVQPEATLRKDWTEDVEELGINIETVTEIQTPDAIEIYQDWDPVDSPDWNLWRKFINMEPIQEVWKERKNPILVEFSAGFISLVAKVDPLNFKGLQLLHSEDILMDEFKEMIFTPLLSEIYKYSISKGISCV